MKNEEIETHLEDFKSRLEKLEKAQRTNNRILKSQWNLRQKVGTLEARIENIEDEYGKKLDQLMTMIKNLSCYNGHKN